MTAQEPEPQVETVPAGQPKMAREFELILTAVYTIKDAWLEYKRLEEALTIGQRRGDRGALQEGLDRAEDNARLAHKLYLNAHLEQEAFDLRCEKVLGPLVEKAHAALQLEKDRGQRNKAITDADVRYKAAEMFPDEWESQQVRRAKAKGMVAQMRKLSDLWEQRCRTLQGMLASLRG